MCVTEAVGGVGRSGEKRQRCDGVHSTIPADVALCGARLRRDSAHEEAKDLRDQVRWLERQLEEAQSCLAVLAEDSDRQRAAAAVEIKCALYTFHSCQ